MDASWMWVEWQSGRRPEIHVASSSVWTPRGFVAKRRTMVGGDTGDRVTEFAHILTASIPTWTWQGHVDRGPRTNRDSRSPTSYRRPHAHGHRKDLDPPHPILEDPRGSGSSRTPTLPHPKGVHTNVDVAWTRGQRTAPGLPPFHVPLASTLTWTPPGLPPPARQGTPTFPHIPPASTLLWTPPGHAHESDLATTGPPPHPQPSA